LVIDFISHFMQIYISRSGERYGPYNLAEVQADIDAGRIQATDLAWHEGASDWAEVWQIDGITLPKRRVPPPPPPVALAPHHPGLPTQPSASPYEMVWLAILTILIPLAGFIFGIIRLSKRQRGGLFLLCLSIVISLLEAIFFFVFLAYS
jgi:hypothetical protein